MQLYPRNRPRVADDLDAIGVEINLGGFHVTFLVAAVVQGVDQRFAQRTLRIVHPAPHLNAVALLLQVSFGQILQVIEAGSQLGNERPPEYTFLLDFPGAVAGELHHFDPGSAEPALRRIRKEEQTCVARNIVSVHRNRETHAPVDLQGVLLVQQTAAHVAQILPHQLGAQVLDPRLQRPAVVPGHPRRGLEQCLQHAVRLRIDGLGAEANPVSALSPNALGRGVRSRITRWRPHHEDVTIIHYFRRDYRLVDGIDSVAIAPYPLLGRRELVRRETGRGQRCPAIFFFHAEHHVAPVQTLQIVGERADRLQHLRAGGLGIPTRLELHANGLHHATVEQIVEIDVQRAAHGVSLSPPASRLTTVVSGPSGNLCGQTTVRRHMA